MGLRFPDDLDAWRAWQQRRRLLRSLRSRLRPTAPDQSAWLHLRGSGAPILVAVESLAASSRYSLLAPLEQLGDIPAAVVAPADIRDQLPGEGWSAVRVAPNAILAALPELVAVLASGHYLPLGAALYAQARDRRLRFLVAQHGLMTPLAPPLPSGAELLAWSAEDAAFWLSGREDLSSTVIGAQVLWQARAAADESEHVSRFTRPTFLGQLHGAELSRASMTRAATTFCLTTGARYRRHPSERDRASRWQHQVWRRLGIEIDDGATPLYRTGSPVVSVYSTGVVEAAARGIPAWVFHPDPPAWLLEFWQRYRLSRWGEAPTPPPAIPVDEPARAVAARLRSLALG